MRPQLTHRQKEVLEFIKEFASEHGYSPTMREICGRFGFQPRAATNHVDALVRKGYLTKQPMTSRSLEVVGFGRRGLTEVPIVGRVAAGEPITAIENIEGAVMLPEEWARSKDCFLLQVEGDSMIDAHIFSGDYVLVKRQDTAENNDIVIALLDDEATAKRFSIEGGRIVLKPENRQMEPIVVDRDKSDFRIIGKVVGVWRNI
jgi:repressor LexA